MLSSLLQDLREDNLYYVGPIIVALMVATGIYKMLERFAQEDAESSGCKIKHG